VDEKLRAECKIKLWELSTTPWRYILLTKHHSIKTYGGVEV